MKNIILKKIVLITLTCFVFGSGFLSVKGYTGESSEPADSVEEYAYDSDDADNADYVTTDSATETFTEVSSVKKKYSKTNGYHLLNISGKNSDGDSFTFDVYDYDSSDSNVEEMIKTCEKYAALAMLEEDKWDLYVYASMDIDGNSMVEDGDDITVYYGTGYDDVTITCRLEKADNE